VSQTYTFKIQDGGKVGVQMDMHFQLAEGASLTGSYEYQKSILDSTDVKSIEDGRVVARDSLGNEFVVNVEDVNGWIRAKFNLSETVLGNGRTYSLSLNYIILDGICSGIESYRFYFPWSHRWIADVIRSEYRIEFPESFATATSMDEVCLAGTGFNRRCGHSGLNIQGGSAERAASGLVHGLFFEWPHRLVPPEELLAGARACPDCGAEEGCEDEEIVRAQSISNTEGAMLPQGEEIKTSSFSTVAVVLAILLCCGLALTSALLRRKLHQWKPLERGKLVDEEMCDEEGFSNGGYPGHAVPSWMMQQDVAGASSKQSRPEASPPASSIASSTTVAQSPPPQSIGSTVTAGINIEIDDSAWPSSPSGAKGIQLSPTGPSSPSNLMLFEQAAHLHTTGLLQAAGQCQNLDSPSASSSGSPFNKAPVSATHARPASPANTDNPTELYVHGSEDDGIPEHEFHACEEILVPHPDMLDTDEGPMLGILNTWPMQPPGEPHCDEQWTKAAGLAPVLEEDEDEEELGATEAAV
jgi:hypothetical protein